VSIELKLLGKTSRVLRAWVSSIALCLGASACISPDLEPPRGAPGSSLPATPTMNGAVPSKGIAVAGAGGSAAAANPGATAPTTPTTPTTTTPPSAAAGRGATTPTGTGNPQTPGGALPMGGAAGAASEASDDGDADAGVP
jgi:hypothetical protein